MKKLAPALGILLVALIIATGWVMHRSSVAAGLHLATEHCGDCHDLTEAKKNEEGPYLWGIVNRRAASIPGFEYSEAFREFAAERQYAWNEANLDLFITDPNQVIPGTRMAEQGEDSKHAKAFSGVQHAEDRDTLIDYLRTLK